MAEANKDNLIIPQALNTRACFVFEVVTDRANRPVKVGYRTVADRQRDICMVVDIEAWKVLTVWANKRSDNHRTLQKGQYDVPKG